MDSLEPRIREIGQQLLSHGGEKTRFLSPHAWSQALLNKMMENEKFRVASLRFTDVAPSLRSDGEFMDHLSAYFGDVGGLGAFIGDGIPGGKLLGRVMAPLIRANIKGMAENFIAGETITDGIKAFEKLHKSGIACSIDLLGEAVISTREAEDFVAAYHEAIEKIATASAGWAAPKYAEADRTGPVARANVSIKLSALYEHVSPTAHDHSVKELCTRFRALLDTAMKHKAFINVDVEQYHLIPITMDVFKTVLMEPAYRGYPHIGIVCQAYLKDGDARLAELIDFARTRGTPFGIRLVKGAYWDFEQAYAEQMNWPCPVFDHKAETDANYEKLTHRLIAGFPAVKPCIGSHNARSIAVAIAAAEKVGLTKGDIEFQMLNGMAEHFRDALVAMGYRLRQYCPVGAFIPGMSYLVRRLLENTANQSFLRMRARSEASTEQLLSKPAAPATADKLQVDRFLNRPLADFAREGVRRKAAAALAGVKLPREVVGKVSGKTLTGNQAISVACPWKGDTVVSRVRYATAADADTAVAAAKAALPAWRALGHAKRADLLDKAADLMETRWGDLFALQVYEAGKDWIHADADIAEAIDFLRYYAREARRLEGDFQPISVWGEDNRTVYESRGVAAVIAPWNFPLAISCGMTAAALVTGNTVVYKPAEQTSAIGQQLYEALIAAGVPADVLHFLPGDGADVGARLVSHPDVAQIAFTGSKEVGLKIVAAAGQAQAGQKAVKKCVIEMGGKNAIVVDSDADLDEAVPAVVKSAFGFQGQKCSACSRAIVVGSAYEPFVARVKEMVEGLRVGGADNPANDTNAVIDADAKAKIEGYIAIGKSDGKVLAQARNVPTDGHFVAPTVVTDLKPGSRLTTEEVFGPVLAVYKADSLEDAVRMATDSDFALTGGVFSRNPQALSYVRENFRVGNLYINRGITGALVGRQPFGGGKMSGTGTKAGGPDYLLNFVEPRVVTENTMRRGYAPKAN